MLSLILGIIGLHFQIKAVSIAAIVLGLIALAFTITFRKGSTLTTLIKFAFELGGLSLGIIGVL